LLNRPFAPFHHDTFMTLRASSGESIAEIVDDVWLSLLG